MKYDDSMAKSITPPKSEVISVQTAFAENEAYPEIKVRNADELDFSVLQSNLGSCLDIINDEVMKGYLSNLYMIRMNFRQTSFQRYFILYQVSRVFLRL